ncbi:zf-HC2 domain-containing protein [Streptomyces sp. AGS-58]|uniref:zf-HC2 domain-containing protein n=1 Tax=unclassified Streptomyces TaxID=2593676 RepID=UPI0035A3CEE9
MNATLIAVGPTSASEESTVVTALQGCRTISNLLAGHALDILESHEAAAVRAHLATCSDCRDEHHCLAAVAAHLSSLRKALAYGAGRQQSSYLPGPAGPSRTRHPRRRSSAARGPLATSLTLSQWVSRLARVR